MLSPQVSSGARQKGEVGYFLSSIIVLAPVMSNYVFYDAFSVGDFFCLLAALLLMGHLKIGLFSVALAGCVTLILLMGLGVLYQDGVDAGFFRMAFYYSIFFYLISLKRLQYKKFFAVYVGCAYFFSISIIIQWILFQLYDVAIPLRLLIPHYELDTLEVIDHIFRSGGWFKEPSYFAIFVTPAFFHLLNCRAYYKYSLLFLAGVVSTSSLAIFVGIISALIYILNTRRREVLLISLGPVILAAIIGVGYFFDDWTFVARIKDVFLDGGTLNERLVPIFGIIEMATLISPNPSAFALVTSAGGDGSIWYSSAAYMLASLGWLGLLFILIGFLRFGSVLGGLLIILTLTAHIFSGAYSFFIVLAFIGLEMETRSAKYELGENWMQGLRGL